MIINDYTTMTLDHIRKLPGIDQVVLRLKKIQHLVEGQRGFLKVFIWRLEHLAERRITVEQLCEGGWDMKFIDRRFIKDGDGGSVSQSTSLDEKLAARSGRLQLVVAAMTTLARSFEDPDAIDYAVDDLMKLAGDFGSRWFNETAMLLKELYNRREGP